MLHRIHVWPLDCPGVPCTLKRGTPIYRMMTSTPRPPPTFCIDCTSSHQSTQICHGISMPVPPIHKFRWTRDMMRLRWIVGRPCGTHDPKGRAPKTLRTSLFCNAAFALSFCFLFFACSCWLAQIGRPPDCFLQVYTVGAICGDLPSHTSACSTIGFQPRQETLYS